jgi:hypothetical protein
MDVFMFLADLVAASGSPAPQSLPNSGPLTAPALSSPLIELLNVIAWPAVALVIGAMFRKPFSAFVVALGGRITKLSLFKVELELVPAGTAAATPFLESIKTAISGADINDSSQTMLEQVEMRTPADFAMIQLGDGDEWLTSRLYIAALMLERMRNVRALVFVERREHTAHRFVAIVTPHQLRWALARKYPWLETARLRAAGPVFSANIDPKLLSGQSVITSDSGAIEPEQARQLTRSFIQSLQKPTPKKEGRAEEWVNFERGVSERASWVTHELLESLVPPSASDAWVKEQNDAGREVQTRAVLRRSTDFVALVDDERKFLRLVNRKALLEELAASATH